MRCPKCKYEPTLSEMQASPDTCPSCGVIYEKYLQALKARVVQTKQKKESTPPVRASFAVDASGKPQQVVITDIRMNFISMVIFMVKWAFAAIPAMIIIFLIVGAMSAVLTGVVAGFVGSSKSASADSSSHISQPASEQPAGKLPEAPLISGYLIEKGFDEDRFLPAHTLKIKFQNSSGKDVVAFEGVVELSDLLGNSIKNVRLTSTAPDWTDNTYYWSGATGYNQFDQSDIELRNTPASNLRMTFDLKKILYVDGQTIEF